MSRRYYFTKSIYNKDSLIKAAYRFTDVAYIHLDTDNENYIVSIEAKEEKHIVSEKEFQNELIAQMVRKQIADQTKTVRELMLARAFSSTIINNDVTEETIIEDYSEEADDILMDWFEKYE